MLAVIYRLVVVPVSVFWKKLNGALENIDNLVLFYIHTAYLMRTQTYLSVARRRSECIPNPVLLITLTKSNLLTL